MPYTGENAQGHVWKKEKKKRKFKHCRQQTRGPSCISIFMSMTLPEKKPFRHLICAFKRLLRPFFRFSVIHLAVTFAGIFPTNCYNVFAGLDKRQQPILKYTYILLRKFAVAC